MKFYKFTNKQENHFGLQYHDGLNMDLLSFNPSGDCESGGIYFAREDILEFCNYWLREVTLPEGEEIYENPGEPKKWKAHQVILGKRRKFDCKLCQELLKIGVEPTNYALAWASANGYLDIVKLLLKIGVKPTKLALAWASSNNHLDIVKLLLEAGVKPTEMALAWASSSGHLELIKLLLEAGIKPTKLAFEWAKANGHLEIVKLLEEWK